jgi:hypothetical protein
MHQAVLGPSRAPWRLKGAHPKSAKAKGSETLSSSAAANKSGKRDRLTGWVPDLILGDTA